MALNLGPVKPHVRRAANEIALFAGTTDIGGWRSSGSVPNSDHPKGLAIDVMTSRKAQGDKISAYVVANAHRLAVTYVIWYDRIWQGGKWKAYDHPAGSSPTLQHRDHVHVSFSPTPSGSAEPPVSPTATLSDAADRVSSWLPSTLVVGAGGLTLAGLLLVAVAGWIMWKGFDR